MPKFRRASKFKVPPWFSLPNNESESMKTKTHMAARIADSQSVPLEAPATSKKRHPVRCGNFWPCENLSNCPRLWDLTGVFANKAIVLPVLIGGNGSRSL